jgi:Ca-activated chloride channel family protein
VEKVWATRRIGELIDEIDLHGQNHELVAELVELSKKHGILTPYTSFLADEHVDLTDRGQVQFQAVQSLQNLNISEGKKGVAQRAFKGSLQAAPRAMPSQKSGGMGGGWFGGFTNRSASPAPAAPGSVPSAASAANSTDFFAVGDGLAAPKPVQTIGEKTFYWKNNRWRDADATAEGEKNPIRIKPFSDAYFALASRENARFAKYLALDGPVLVVLDGKTYLIEPAAGR